MPESKQRFILTLSCPDRKGIVRAVSNFLYDLDATILEAAQHSDTLSNRFFLRMEFAPDSQETALDLEQLNRNFAGVVQTFNMDWAIRDAARYVKTVIAVSKADHCLNDVLHRWQSGILPIDIMAVVSNHPDLAPRVQWYGLPFHYWPVTEANKQEQESRILELMRGSDSELLLLARYMQILSDSMCEGLPALGSAINIHHSFLPGFKGAKPYHQAYDRGVKIIGATAHYVTSDLDEGPIIEQCVERVDHESTPERLMQIGRDTECIAFARAIKWHCEHRIIRNGKRTVVFK